MTDILYPKATAVWLVDNTSLTFEQIADFCGLHPLEVKRIADDVNPSIRGADPIGNGQLTREELAKAGGATLQPAGEAEPQVEIHEPELSDEEDDGRRRAEPTVEGVFGRSED